MRTRAVREGSVGLLILLGIGLFGGLFLWIRGLTFGKQSYKAVIEFANVGGIQKGAAVRYRGVKVGKVSNIRPGPNGVEVETEITPANVIIPRDVVVEANQAGLISEVSIDITPQKNIPPGVVAAKPLDKNCDRTLIICNGSHLQGQIGISFDQLIRSATRLTTIYSDPNLFNNINAATKNASVAGSSVVQLTRDLRDLTKSAQKQLGSISTTATSVQRAANQISASTSTTATRFSATADQLRLTGAQANRLITDLDVLITTNRSTLVTTLNNLSQTSEQLRVSVSSLTPTINRFNRGKLLDNLETLSANAAQASANLRAITTTFNNPTNLLLLQQTLDSARVTFQNAQKITSDLDELTGDPKIRENLRRLINGLSGLVSSTQDLQQQVHLAQTLDSMKANKKQPVVTPDTVNKQVIPIAPALNDARFSAESVNAQTSPLPQSSTPPTAQRNSEFGIRNSEFGIDPTAKARGL